MEEVKTTKQLLKEIKSLKDKKGFLMAGLPRFGRLFGRDSLISAWQLLDFDPEICKATLKALAQFQGKKTSKKTEEEPGKILHEVKDRAAFPFDYYGSVDSTPLFLILFSFFFQKTKDKNFIKKYWPNIKRAIEWMENYGDKDEDGFLEYQRESKGGLLHQGWKDGFEDHLDIKPPVALVEPQGYRYLALKETAKLAEISGEEKYSQELLERAQILKKNFNQKFWMKNKKYFALALDGDKKQKKAITSNPGHLFFTGIVEKDKEKATVK
ncbi:amylo-alpha-1,6-glucosidase, partial [Patescibacteria group bacterium]